MDTTPTPKVLGTITIGRTVYEVTLLETGPGARQAGIVANYGLKGPRGALYIVTDWGDEGGIRAVALQGLRTLRGLTREHFAPFRDAGKTPLELATARWIAADEAWGAELRKVYGREAGDARYDPKRQEATPQLMYLHRSLIIAAAARDAHARILTERQASK